MKRTKKIVRVMTMVLALVMALSTFVCAANITFTDVKDTDWFYPELIYAVDNELINGTSATTFSPSDPMTRAQFVTVVGRAMCAAPATGSKFIDVPANSYYTSYVYWAVENGIVNGTSSNTFSPDSNITRQDMATIIGRLINKFGFELPTGKAAVSQFKDADQISGYAKESVEMLREAGILKGDTAGYLNPKAEMTRAEGMAVLVRAMQATNDFTPPYYGEEDDTEPEPEPEPEPSPEPDHNEDIDNRPAALKYWTCDNCDCGDYFINEENPFFSRYAVVQCEDCGTQEFRYKDDLRRGTLRPTGPASVTNPDGSITVTVLMNEKEAKTVTIPADNRQNWTNEEFNALFENLGCQHHLSREFMDGVYTGKSGWKIYCGENYVSGVGYGYRVYTNDVMPTFQEACIRALTGLNNARIDAYLSDHNMADVIFEAQAVNAANGVAKAVNVNWYYLNK